MSANMFGFASGAAFQNPRVWAFNKAQMYAGAPTVQIVSFDAPASRLHRPPEQRAPADRHAAARHAQLLRLDVAVPERADRLQVPRRLGQHLPLDLHRPRHSHRRHELAERRRAERAIAGGSSLDVLQIRAMVQNQYTNIGGAESLWNTHTVRRANTTGFAAPRWYQVNVTGGTVAATIPQAATWDPDARERHAPLHAQPGGRPRRQHGHRLQHLERHDQSLHQVRRAGWRPIRSTPSARPSRS